MKLIPKSLAGFGILSYLCQRETKYGESRMGDDDARNHIGHYLCHTSENCKCSHMP